MDECYLQALGFQLAPNLSYLSVNSSKFATVHCCKEAVNPGCEE